MIAQEPDISFKTLFCSDWSVRAFHDPEFRRVVEWDVPLIEGYDHEFLSSGPGGKKLSFLSPWVKGIEERLAQGRYDFLWVHGWGHWTYIRAIRAAKQLGIKVLIRGESNLHLPRGGPLKRLLKQIWLKRLFSKVDGFLAIGTWNREFYLNCGVDPCRIAMVPYAVDNDFFQAQAAMAVGGREQLRASLGLRPGRPVILYASKLTERKRPLDLLDAYSRLSPDGRREPHPYLLFVGDGEMSAALENRAAQSGWSSIKFLGFKNQTELPRYYDLCDIFVLPSLNEPWGLVVNEVMNAGRAVIVSDQVGSGADLVRDGENGAIFRAGDVADLHRTLVRLLHEEGFRAMGRRSIELIEHWGFREDIAGLKQMLSALERTI